MKIFDRFKRRKPGVYISLGVYVLLIFVIIFESCLRSGASGLRSKFIADISAWFINLINGPQKVEVIKPKGIKSINETSLLGKDGEYYNIVVGTTSLLSIELEYPSKKNKDDVLDKTYTTASVSGSNSDYTISQSVRGDKNSFTLDLRFTATNKTSSSYQVDVNFSNNVKYEYKFKIVDRTAPTQYEITVPKKNLKIGETTTINTKLIGYRGETLLRDDYLRRYYDVSLIESNSSNPSVATIDKYGVIHAHSEGSSVITYGISEPFTVTVSNEHINVPSSNTLSLEIDPNSNSNPHLLDYDYVYDPYYKDIVNVNNYSTIVYYSFSDTSLDDQSVSWEIESNNLNAMIGPYEYDENGYPVYVNTNTESAYYNRPCIRVMGYRNPDTITLKCISNVDSTILESRQFEIVAATATNMEVKSSAGSFEVMLGDQIIISAEFKPLNTQNKAINVSSSADITISNNNSGSVIIKPNSVGSFTLTVTSVSNPSLGDTITLNVTAKQVINDDNYDDFSSFMRKFAGHMGLFLVTAISGFIFFYQFFNDKKKRILWAIGCTLGAGIIIAGISEFIQYFVPTRSGEIKDVGIDTIGTVLGVLICALIWLIIYIIKKYKNKNNKDP